MAEVLPSLVIASIAEKIFRLLQSNLRDTKKTKVVPVAMFDLSGSTKLKLREGHSVGTRLAIEHNLLCEQIAEKYEGIVIKHMGDGVFLQFNDPVNACRAAVSIKKAVVENGRFATKGAVTIGVVEQLEIGGIKDLLGSTIDRCARMTSMANPNQVLIDQTMMGVTESFLRDDKELIISEPITRRAKGIGEILIFEISLKEYEFTGFSLPTFNIIEDGRMPLREKMDFLACAKNELIELGIGLSSFSDNYYRQRPTEVKDKIIKMLQKGVNIKCVILDPNSDNAKIYVNDNKEPKYLERMKTSKELLVEMKKELQKSGYNDFHIMIYDALPRFHASCIDMELPTGMMSISHYLPKIPRSRNPVIQFSKYSNPQLFDRYKSIIEGILENSYELKM